MMYLSRLVLNPRSRQVQSEIARPYQIHKTILRAYPEKLPPDERVLFRLEEDPRTHILTLLVQSQYQPDWNHLLQGKNYLMPLDSLPSRIAENPATKQVDLKLTHRQLLSFRLCANPTKKIKVEGKKQGQRVGLFKEVDQLEWLNRKIQAAGASLVNASIRQDGNLSAWQVRAGRKNKITMLGVRYEGILQALDPQVLCLAVDQGIGSGKALGFGMLSLAPYRG